MLQLKFFFLDVVDVVQAPTAGALGYSFYMVVIATILVEAIVMLVMKYNLFGKSLLHLFLVLLLLLKIPSTGSLNVSGFENNYHSLKPDRHDLIMILLLTVIALRSAVWNIFQLLHDGDYGWLGVIAAAAFTGKLAGGWIADKIGWRLYVYISLFTAAPLVTFFKNELVLFCIGIGLLQSGIPATTALLIKAAKGRTERGVGLSFGTAVIAGGIIFTIPVTALQNQILIPCFILSFTLALFWLATREKNVL